MVKTLLLEREIDNSKYEKDEKWRNEEILKNENEKQYLDK